MKQSSYLFDEEEICSFIKQHQKQTQLRSNQHFYSSRIYKNKSNTFPRGVESSSANKWENVELYESVLPSVLPIDGLYSRELFDDTDIQSTLSSPTASISVSTTQPVRSYNSSRYSSSVVAKPHQKKIVYCGNVDSESEHAISLRQQFEIDLRRKLNEQRNLFFTGFRRSRSVSPMINRYLNIDPVSSNQNFLITRKAKQPIVALHRRTRSLSPKKAAYAARGSITEPYSELERSQRQPRSSQRLQWNDYFTKNKIRKSAAESEKFLEIKKKLIVDYSAPPPAMAVTNKTSPMMDKRPAAITQATVSTVQARFLSTKYDKKAIAKNRSLAAAAVPSSSIAARHSESGRVSDKYKSSNPHRLLKSPVPVSTSGQEKKIGTKLTATSTPPGSSLPSSLSSPFVRNYMHVPTSNRSIPLSNDKVVSHEIDRLLRRKKLAPAPATCGSPCTTTISTAVGTDTVPPTTTATTSSNSEQFMIEPADTAPAITLESLSEHSSSDSNDQQQLFEISASFSTEVFENLEDSSAATTSPGSTITPKRYSIPDDFVLRESPPKPVRLHPLFKDTLVSTVLTLKEQIRIKDQQLAALKDFILHG